MWHLTPDTWHVTHDMWHVTHGKGEGVKKIFSQNFNSLGLWVWALWFLEDWEEKDDWMNELVTKLFVEQPPLPWVYQNPRNHIVNANQSFIWKIWQYVGVYGEFSDICPSSQLERRYLEGYRGQISLKLQTQHRWSRYLDITVQHI